MLKKIYLLSNNCLSSNKITLENKNYLKHQYISLSNKGIAKVIHLSQNSNLNNIEKIYTSSYVSAIETANILAEEKKLNITIAKELDERQIGDLEGNEYQFLKGMQEHDFSFKLKNGESINEVQTRVNALFKKVLTNDKTNNLLITHEIVILSLLANYCLKGYSLEDNLILEYKDDVIYNGERSAVTLILLTIEDNQIKNIQKII